MFIVDNYKAGQNVTMEKQNIHHIFIYRPNFQPKCILKLFYI